jgi:hypothetical protein
MSTFTGSELEFLAGLDKSWWRLYWKEFSRLRRIEAKEVGGAPAFAAELGACGEDLASALRRRNGADAAAVDALLRRVELAAGNR